MLAEERKNKIVTIVNKNKFVKVTHLSQVLNTTEATIRRDLDELEKSKRIQRVHGGAVSLRPTNAIFSDTVLSAICIEEKKLIAQKAYNFINHNDSIIFDASTTSLELIKLIAQGSKKNLTIITNSFNALPILSIKKDIQVIHIGGNVDYNMNLSTGPIPETILNNIKADKCFLGANGIDIKYGYSVPTIDDASAKKHMLESSKQNFILADHTKFGETYMHKFADFSGVIDCLITDCFPYVDDEFLKYMHYYETSVHLVVADTKHP